MIKFTLNSKDILDACKDEYESAKKAIYSGFNSLVKAMPGHMAELVTTELNSHQKQMFLGKSNENVTLDIVDPVTAVITIKNFAVPIDNGEEIDMKTDEWLMKGPITPAGEPGVHMSKKGKKYRIIPFEHGGKGGDTSETAKFKTHLTGRIHEELELENKRRKANGQSKIHFGGIERYKQNSLDQNGKLHKKGEIIEGKVHDLSIFGSKEKSHWSTGPLTRLAVYQKIHKDAQGNPITNKAGKVKASRSWLTFRTASQGVPDKFIYPAPPTKDFLQRTGEWAEEEFYNKILPAIFEKWGDK